VHPLEKAYRSGGTSFFDAGEGMKNDNFFVSNILPEGIEKSYQK